jgi:hypothetical protein
LLEPIGSIPPVELEALYYERLEAPAMVAGLTLEAGKKHLLGHTQREASPNEVSQPHRENARLEELVELAESPCGTPEG